MTTKNRKNAAPAPARKRKQMRGRRRTKIGPAAPDAAPKPRNYGSRGTPRALRVRADGTKREVTSADYETMTAIFAEFGMMSVVVARTGFHLDTVRRYVDRGDPTRGWPPIGERVAKLHEAARAKADAATADSLAAVHMRVRAISRAHLGIAEVLAKRAQRAARALDELGDAPPPGTPEAKEWDDKSAVLIARMRTQRTRDIVDTGKFAIFAHGGADARLDVTGAAPGSPAAQFAALAGKSDEELLAMVHAAAAAHAAPAADDDASPDDAPPPGPATSP